jgi:uncharacterized protein (DUF2235 family)
VIDMPKKEVHIYKSKAVIFQNDYAVWQLRIWLADEDKYFRQSFRTRDKAKAIADVDEMYEDIKYMKRRGKKIYSISIKQAVKMFIEVKAKYVGIHGANGIVDGSLTTFKAHMNHFLKSIDEKLHSDTLNYRFMLWRKPMVYLKSKIKIAIILVCVSATQAMAEYKAVLSCGFNGSHINILACFDGTDLKLTNNGQTGIYKIYNISQLGREYRDGFHINLSTSFSLTAQNSDDTLTLGIKIYDANNTEVYQDMVGKYGVIKVGN